MRKDELMHYGVKGMKWGVRRNVRVLATHRRNVKVKKIKSDYKSGRIDKAKKQSRIKKANVDKKMELEKLRSDINNVRNKEEFRSVKNKIAIQTINEVPGHMLKKVRLQLINTLALHT